MIVSVDEEFFVDVLWSYQTSEFSLKSRVHTIATNWYVEKKEGEKNAKILLIL